MSSAAGQQADATLRTWRQYTEAQAAAAQAAARSTAVPPAQPRPLKRLRKVADAALGGNDDAKAGATGADSGDGATATAADTVAAFPPAAIMQPSDAAAMQLAPEAAGLQQSADMASAGNPTADAHPQAADGDTGGVLQLPQGMQLAATAQLASQVGILDHTTDAYMQAIQA